jgi:hypothetical protein
MAKREPPLEIDASFEDAVKAFLKTPPPPPGHPSTRKQKAKKKSAKKR